MKILASVLVALQVGVGTAAATAAPPEAVTAVDSISIPVTDLERAVSFYTHVLGFEATGDREAAGGDYEHFFGVFGAHVRVVRLRLGDESIELLQFIAPRGRSLPDDLHSNDRAFQHIAIIVRDIDEAYARLRENHVEQASSGPQVLPEWNPNAGGIAAFYFRDPDGNFLEILHFPSGKGAARWQARDRLFLGIDHTAIVVADTAASIHHYRDLLGLRIAGESENYGSEQEHLNNVFGARLRITALRAARGPGVELLEYLTPRNGRTIPVDSQANDRWYWQINFVVPRPEALYERTRSEHVAFVSNGIVTLESPALGLGRGFVARDPDGHAAAMATALIPSR